MESNQTFCQMHQTALHWLAGRDPAQIAINAGVDYDEDKQTFSFSTMGIDITVTYPDYGITPQLSGWHQLLILHYLHLADGTPLTGRGISFSQMNSGMVRGGGIDRKCELAIGAKKNLTEAALTALCRRLGGERIPSNADVAYRIPFLPRFPVTLTVWLPDEEFPASGRMLPDASADHYLTIEDAITVAEVLLEEITREESV